MSIELAEHQEKVIDKLKSGSILCGGVGSGKSRTALTYYFKKECKGNIKINGKGDYAEMKLPKDLYIITTARKRDLLEWEKECAPFILSTDQKLSINGVKVIIDSWNNIHKYINVKNAFFILDEQRVIGSGLWVKSFLKITKNNSWILLSATPGDTWMDYVPVFIANGFYKNRTEFLRRHVVYNHFTKYPKIDHYVEVARLMKLKQSILVDMQYVKLTIPHNKTIIAKHDEKLFKQLVVKRWNVYENKPIKNISELCYLMRKVVNSDLDRLTIIRKLFRRHQKLIIFYNFNYELEMLKNFGKDSIITTAEWNGHKHELIPNTNEWIYLVQYTAGAEGWNCIETNCIVFFSQSYSYKATIQAAGRIDRFNTLFTDLYYYYIRSESAIDLAIEKTLKGKQDFNEQRAIQSVLGPFKKSIFYLAKKT